MITVTFDEKKWKLVPVNPTEDMIIAVSKGLAERVKPSRYKAMLSLAPTLLNIEDAGKKHE